MGIYQLTDRIIDPTRYPWGYMVSFWTPAEITTALWLDAADSDTITLAIGAVSQWDDKSGNNRHATQANTASRPAVSSGSLNSLNVVRFDGSNDYMNLSSVGELTKNVAGFSAFCVSGKTLASPTGSVFFLSTTDSGTTRSIFYGSGGDIIGAGRRLDADTSQSHSVASSGVCVFSVEFDYSSANLHVGVNGSRTARDGGFQTAGNTSDTASSAGYIGGLPTTLHLDGDIAEIIFIRHVLSASDRQKLEGYLAHKWGLTANLPGDHPYKTFAPRA